MQETLKNHQFKIAIGTAVAVVLFVIGTTSSLTTRLERIDAEHNILELKCQTNTEQLERDKAHITTLEAKANEADLDRTKILVKLENIEVALLELKQALMQHD